MSYVAKKPLGGFGRIARPTGMSGVVDKAAGIVKAGAAILGDPALPEITGIVLELQSMEKKRGGGATSLGPGIGLSAVVPPLRAFRWYKKNPWVGSALLAAAVGLPFLAGYAFGKRSR
jgi:uncharacterized membrane protein